MNTTREYYVSPNGTAVGTQRYYTEAMDACYYGVEDTTGRAFRNAQAA